MFINDPIFGFIALAWAMVVNRILAQRALKRLSTEEKARLLDAFSKHRTNSVLVAFGLLLLFYVAGRISPGSYSMLAWVMLGLILFMSAVSTFVSFRKLKRLSMPKEYISNFLVRCVIYYAGIGVLLFTLIKRFFPQ